jgi:hypothetical protein
MAISRFATSSVAQGLPKYQKLWDQSTVYVPPSFESIATTTVGSGGAASITFSSIPSTYKHLQIRFTMKNVTTGGSDMHLNFNGDSGTNYYGHYLWGYGSGSANGGNAINTFTNTSNVVVFYDQGIADTYPVSGIIDILDYASTTKYKTTKSMVGRDSNGSGQLWYCSGLWKNTSATNSLTLTYNSNNFPQFSSVALYGIRG